MIATAMTTAMILAVMSSCSSWGLELPGSGSSVEAVKKKQQQALCDFFLFAFYNGIIWFQI